MQKVEQIELKKEDLIDGYLEMKRLSGISHFTYQSHEGVLKRFFRFYKGNLDDKELPTAVRRFMVDMNNEHYDRTLQVLKGFFNYCIEEEVAEENPTKGLKYKPHTVRIVDHDVETIRALLKLPNKKTFTGLRDYGFILLMLDTGIRPFEALNLRISDFHDKSINVREEVSKTRQGRVLPISPLVSQTIKRLINARHKSWDNDTGYLFCSFTGYGIVSRHMQLRFRLYSKELGLSVTPYHLRHVFALYYCRNGGDVFSLQRIMGHQTLNMTQRYVALVQTDLSTNHAKASPISNFLEGQKRVVNIKDGKR